MSSPFSYKRTIVWQWLQAVRVDRSTELGKVYGILRARMDMPHQLPHKTYLLRYLTDNCRVDPAVARTYCDDIWDNYASYRNAALHNFSAAPLKWDRRSCSYVADDGNLQAAG